MGMTGRGNEGGLGSGPSLVMIRCFCLPSCNTAYFGSGAQQRCRDCLVGLTPLFLRTLPPLQAIKLIIDCAVEITDKTPHYAVLCGKPLFPLASIWQGRRSSLAVVLRKTPSICPPLPSLTPCSLAHDLLPGCMPSSSPFLCSPHFHPLSYAFRPRASSPSLSWCSYALPAYGRSAQQRGPKLRGTASGCRAQRVC